MTTRPTFDPENAIAIVGMAGRFAKSPDVETLWAHLRDAVECFTDYTDQELLAAGVDAETLALPNYVKRGAPLEDMEGFDPGFFGFSPLDGAILDPQHRHMLECAWEALENAAIDPTRFAGSIGVFAGSGYNAYLSHNLLSNPDLLKQVGFFLLRHTGNDKDFLATRVSYCFKLSGPSLNIQTACSTSLVAVHVACQSLINRECDLALAGGASIELPHRRGYLYEEGEILAPDGRCRAFDAASQGTVFGSGAGVVVLRRYQEAVDQGDIVHGVILGSAINNDGANKVGYLAPSVEGQAACIGEALALADVDPATIGYVECHGTGTTIGDPIEVAALTQAFREHTEDRGYCGIGSIKPNIGHTDTAAGVAGLIKAVQALRHRQLPPCLHFERSNPSIDFQSTPFYVNSALRAWAGEFPRRAAVNSLGVGGTNAFVVLEEAPERAASGAGRPWELLTLSAQSPAALEAATDRLAQHLTSHPEQPLADVAYTLALGRQDFEQRRACVLAASDDAACALRERRPGAMSSQRALADRKVAFLFPGGGAQYPNMGRELYDSEPVYRREIDGGLELLAKHVDWELAPLLFPAAGEEAQAAQALQQGSRSLTSLFISELALARLFMAWGVEPKALLGHSMGEYVAACLADVFSVEDGLRLVLKRGQLFERLEAGAMLSVPLPEAELRSLLDGSLDIAVINTPSITVASGPVSGIEALQQRLAARDIETHRVKIHVAAHSRMLEPILPAFAEFTRTIDFKPPKLPVLSNVTGSWLSEQEATNPDYWVRHLRSPVLFSDNLETLLADEACALLEVAPGRTLSSLARMHPAQGRQRVVFNSLRHPDDDESDLGYLLKVLGGLWTSGVSVDWEAFFEGQTRQRVELPSYPFEHQRCWIEPGRTPEAVEPPSLDKRADVGEWFYLPEWRRQPLSSELADADAGAGAAAVVVVFSDEQGLGTDLGRRLSAGQRVIMVRPGSQFSLTMDAATVRPDRVEDFEELLLAAGNDGRPLCLVHLWSMAGHDSSTADEAAEHARAMGFESLLHLGQAIARREFEARLLVVTHGALQVAGEPVPHPEQAMVLGPVKVMQQELAGVVSSVVDVAAFGHGPWRRRLLLDMLKQELWAGSEAQVVAYRGQDRFVRDFVPARLPPVRTERLPLATGGVYLITGGLGGLGLVLAEHLAKTYRASLVLVARTSLPPRETWQTYVAEHGSEDPLARRLEQLRRIETNGGDVLVSSADVTSEHDMRRVVAEALQRFGRLSGVFHLAGTLDDGVIALKTTERARAVLAPKVLGAIALDSATADLSLELFVLYSSVSSISGLAGQVDYAAANAFLDSFAAARSDRRGQPTVAVNWGTWQHVGMAAELAHELGIHSTGAAQRPVHHPWLDRCVRAGVAGRAYETDVSCHRHWFVAEHRLRGGEALLPGTGYLELARGALAETPRPDAVVEFTDWNFLAPFSVPDTAASVLRVSLEPSDTAAAYRVEFSSVAGVHATGNIAFRELGGFGERVPLDEIARRCREPEPGSDVVADVHLDFGPRWNNRRRIELGDREALLYLELAPEYHSDLPALALHPALLDLATAGAQSLLPGYDAARDFYVPWGYGRLVMLRPLTPRVVSHVRLVEVSPEIALFSVTVSNDAGEPLVKVDEFSMRKLTQGAELVAQSTASNGVSNPASSTPTTGNPILQLGLDRGIEPDEGLAALERLLAAPFAAQVVVVSQDLGALLAATRRPTADAADSKEGGVASLARPSLATPYVAPESELHRQIVAIFEQLLGVSGVGIHDDFFDLGGHSLLLTQVVSRVRKQANADLALRVLFQKRSVAGIAEEVDKARRAGGETAPKLRRVSRDAYRIKRDAQS